MGLPIWRSPPSSPKPAAAHVSDHVGGSSSRSSIRRRPSPRTSPRDNAHRFPHVVSVPRSTRGLPVVASGARAAAVATVESLSSIDASLNDLNDAVATMSNAEQRFEQQRHLELGAQRRERIRNLLRSAESAPSPRTFQESRRRRLEAANALSRRDGDEPPVDADGHYQHLELVRHEIERLENNGMALREQRRQLYRLETEFNIHSREADEMRAFDPEAQTSIGERESVPADSDLPSLPLILDGELRRRFTSSPQQMREPLQPFMSGFRASTSSGPEMELPPLRRMSNRPTWADAVETVDNGPVAGGPLIDGPIIDGQVIDGPVIDGPVDAVDGLGDRARSVESESAEENWNTMLSTIAPDTRLPSASSSFASTAASQSFHGSNNSSRAPSAFSARTSVTVPEDPACDGDDVWNLIGERLSRGEDVPDEMWRNAGAPPTIARTIARTTRERL